MARELPYIAAINEAIHLEMARDESVLFFGQNMATTENEPFVDAFGRDRVRVTPISETAEIGIAVGAALAGYRPVVELYMAEFMLVAMDQVVNEAPRFRYMSGGKVKVPVVLKAGYGFTAGWAGQHTGTIYGMFMGVPGLKVAVPATAACISARTSSAIRSASSGASTPSSTSRARKRGTGSPRSAASYSSGAPNFSTASCSGKCSGTPGGAMMLPWAESR